MMPSILRLQRFPVSPFQLEQDRGAGMSRSRRQRAVSRRGSILIVVSWTLFFLGGLAVAVSTYVSTSLREAARTRDELAVGACAASLVARVMMHAMADTNAWDGATEPWRADEMLFNLELEGAVAVITGAVQRIDGSFATRPGLVDEEGKINVAEADLPLLRSLLQHIGGLGTDSALAMARAVHVWQGRMPDGLTAGGGNGYSASVGLDSMAGPGRPMRSIYELRLIEGLDDELFARLRPHVTVYGRGKINLNAASPKVLECLALVRMGSEPREVASLVGRIVEFRDAGQAFDAPSAPRMLAALRESGPLAAGEVGVFRAMAARAGIETDVFSGVCVAMRNSAWRRVEFVFDRRTQELVWWDEQ